jgi:opacity protein-like surface antigen
VLRASLAWHHFNAKLDELEITTDGSGTPPFNEAATFHFSEDAADDAGFDTDQYLNIFTGNLYYDFKTGTKVTPYAGIGGGFADFEMADDAKWTWTFALGATYDLDEETTFGLRYQNFYIGDMEDEDGVEYKPFNAHLFMATLGFEFN